MAKWDGVSDSAVVKATRRTWDEWIGLLDQDGASDWEHKKIAARLAQHYELSMWWSQTIAVGYEKAKGKRVIGQTANSGFQMGVQKTLPMTAEGAWRLVTSPPGVSCWLGEVDDFALKVGQQYSTAQGAEGEIRVVRPSEYFRFTWKTKQMKKAATVQIRIMEGASQKAAVKIHVENLASQEAREQMKGHWRGVLAELQELAR